MKNEKPKIIMLRGLPASGKSTWAREQLTPQAKIKRVNKDELRAMLDNGVFSKLNEDFILQLRNFIVESALSRGESIIIDDTNFAPKHELALSKIASMYGTTVEIKDFDTSLEECIARDAKREKPVGEKVIRDMHKMWCQKKGLDKPSIPFDPTLPRAIICDLDGTVALMGNRNPYDASNCQKDACNDPIMRIVGKFSQDHAIIFMSGRDAKYMQQTIGWINSQIGKNGFARYEGLLMRASNDRRKDAIVKKELYEEYVNGKYNVDFVLDDRDQVVEMWRSIGLTCLQVAPGNF